MKYLKIIKYKKKRERCWFLVAVETWHVTMRDMHAHLVL